MFDFTISSTPGWTARLSAVGAAARALVRGVFTQRGDGLVYNNRNDGPPDLDELWRDFNRKLSGLFGGKPGGPVRNGGDNGEGGGGGGGSPFQPDMKSAGIGAGLITVVVVLVWLGSGFYIVQEGQQSVVTTFGKYSTTTEAGFKWRFPYPIQAHETVSVSQLQAVEVGRNNVNQATGLRDSSMLTQDENIVDIRFTVQYRRADARDYLFENRSPDDAVVQAAESAVREIVGRSAIDQVLYEQRDAIAADLVKNIQSQLDKLQAGIVISNVNVQNVQVPDQVQGAFNDAVKATADRDRFRNEGQAYASDVIPKARGTAARLMEEAAGYRSRVEAQAEGDAQRFRLVLAEYQKAPTVTRDRLYTETMQQVYSNVTKVMVDSRSGSNLLYLPLDKLLQMGPPTTQQNNPPALIPSPASTEQLANPSSTDARSRDDISSRARESR